MGRLFCARYRSDDETLTESLNPCMSDELASRFVSHQRVLRRGAPTSSCRLTPPRYVEDQTLNTHTCTLCAQGHVSVHCATRCIFSQLSSPSCRHLIVEPSNLRPATASRLPSRSQAWRAAGVWVLTKED